MQRDRQMMASLMTAILAVGILTISTNVRADVGTGPQELEKCYGVVRSGQNDCDTNMGSCVPSVIDASPTEWIYLPKGICNRLVGGSTSPNSTLNNPSANPLPDAGVVGNTGIVGGSTIDSAPIMQDTTILNGGSDLKGGTNTPSTANTPGDPNTNPSTDANTNNSGSELNKY